MEGQQFVDKTHKYLLIGITALVYGYVGLALSAAHADAGSVWRQDLAHILGIALIVVAILAAVVYAPRYLAQQAQQAAKAVLEEAPEQRTKHIAHEVQSTRAKAIGLVVFFAAAAIYQCYFTPDAQYSRVQSELDRLEGHEREAIARLVENGRDLESARFLVATRIKRLHVEADRLWPETKAAKKPSPELPPGVLQP
jgi:hypothetical protein